MGFIVEEFSIHVPVRYAGVENATQGTLPGSTVQSAQPGNLKKMKRFFKPVSVTTQYFKAELAPRCGNEQKYDKLHQDRLRTLKIS
jgi:hypothetical protein